MKTTSYTQGKQVWSNDTDYLCRCLGVSVSRSLTLFRLVFRSFARNHWHKFDARKIKPAYRCPCVKHAVAKGTWARTDADCVVIYRSLLASRYPSIRSERSIRALLDANRKMLGAPWRRSRARETFEMIRERSANGNFHENISPWLRGRALPWLLPYRCTVRCILLATAENRYLLSAVQNSLEIPRVSNLLAIDYHDSESGSNLDRIESRSRFSRISQFASAGFISLSVIFLREEITIESLSLMASVWHHIVLFDRCSNRLGYVSTNMLHAKEKNIKYSDWYHDGKHSDISR